MTVRGYEKPPHIRVNDCQHVGVRIEFDTEKIETNQ
jgi:hypothetical protein